MWASGGQTSKKVKEIKKSQCHSNTEERSYASSTKMTWLSFAQFSIARRSPLHLLMCVLLHLCVFPSISLIFHVCIQFIDFWRWDIPAYGVAKLAHERCPWLQSCHWLFSMQTDFNKHKHWLESTLVSLLLSRDNITTYNKICAMFS